MFLRPGERQFKSEKKKDFNPAEIKIFYKPEKMHCF